MNVEVKYIKEWKIAFIVLSVIVAILIPYLSFDYGITEDEQAHCQHGKSILDYFTGKNNIAARSPIDSTGKLQIISFDDNMNDISGEMNIYGGTFDLLCAIANEYVFSFGEYETRHFINSLFGVLLIVFTGLFTTYLGGWRAGTIALLLMALTPRIIAHSMNNPKDIPFAALYIICLYFIFRFVEELPKPKLKTWLPLLICIPLAADIRISGLLLIVYLILFVCYRWNNLFFEKNINKEEVRIFFRSLTYAVVLSVCSYLLISILWPFAQTNPLKVPYLALSKLSDLDITWDSHDLFEGKWIVRSEMPWYLGLKWLFIGNPLFLPLGLATSVFIFIHTSNIEDSFPIKKILMLVFTFAFPVLYVIFRGSYLYNDTRHILFVVPCILALSALSFENLFRILPNKFLKYGFAILVSLTMLQPLIWMNRNHPHEVAYFSPLIGGTDGAWKKYETDFWGNAVRHAAEWIHENVPPGDDKNPVKVRIWYGNFLKGSYYIEKKKGYKAMRDYENSPNWDYYIMQTTAAKNFPDWLTNWPPPGTIHEIKADNIPLCAIIKNPWKTQPILLTQEDSILIEKQNLPKNLSFDDYMNLSFKKYESKQFEACVGACLLALQLNPSSDVAYNNICAAYNELKEWEKAKKACQEALRINSEFTLAKNNLNWASDMISKQSISGKK